MKYNSVIQKVIEHIEIHLHEIISLETVAQLAGFSKYHFHRVFLNEVGVSVSEYVRYRRIANSANLLIYTNEKIIDIAFYYQFESQEAFTRAFKKYYNLPPGQYRKMMGKLTYSLEEKGMKNKEILKGWSLSGSHPFNYEMGIDREIVHKGKASGYLKAIAVKSQEEFSTMMQQFKADKYLGKRIRLSGFIKSKDVDGFCGFWLRIDNSFGDVLQFDNMSNRPIVGNTEWNHYAIILDIPESSASISFGVLLSGNGQVWIDELKFDEVDKTIPTTNIDITQELLDEPTNLSFEE